MVPPDALIFSAVNEFNCLLIIFSLKSNGELSTTLSPVVKSVRMWVLRLRTRSCPFSVQVPVSANSSKSSTLVLFSYAPFSRRIKLSSKSRAAHFHDPTIEWALAELQQYVADTISAKAVMRFLVLILCMYKRIFLCSANCYPPHELRQF